jgi:hypothetical protein
MKLIFGEKNKVYFTNDADFYLCLGFLLNSSKGIRFDWEVYDNKWGIEGRIWITNSSNAPLSLRNAFSKGTDTIDNRLNCNEYISYLYKNFGIINGRNQNLNNISSRVPAQYLKDFNRGLTL